VLQSVRQNTKRTQEGLDWANTRKYKTNPRRAGLGQHSKIQNEPKTSNSERSDGRFDIWTIFVRAVAAGGMRGGDMMGNIGQIPAGGT
jgi:hypothetical protein